MKRTKKLTEFNSMERYEKFCKKMIEANEICEKCPYWIEREETCGHLILINLEKKGLYNNDGTEAIPF